MDTTHILFICGGTFVGLEDIIRKRLGKRQIGFACEDAAGSRSPRERADVLAQVQPEDLIEFGMIPDEPPRSRRGAGPGAAGRPDRIRHDPRIRRPAAAVRDARAAGRRHADQHPDRAEERAGEAVPEVLPHGRQRAGIHPRRAALIAERALKRDTGARALRAVCEEIMLDLMYKLPDQQQGGKYVITRRSSKVGENLFEIKPERRKESA